MERMETEHAFCKDSLKVMIFSSRSGLGHAAGLDAAEAIKEAVSRKGEANVMFAAAPSQNETLATLCADPYIDWNKVNAFHMDEYIGLPEEHPAGFRYYLRERIFDRFSFASVNLLNGNVSDPEAEAVRYSSLLEAYPIDVCLCGIGENGHLAFNDPPVADFCDPLKVKIVSLDTICRIQQVHDGCFMTLEEVPACALTVTIPALMSSRCMICSVPASSKANAVRQTLEGEIGESCPATILRTHPDARLYLDRDSAGLIEAG
jgi:glucosamine-6-phosphate deaminase